MEDGKKVDILSVILGILVVMGLVGTIAVVVVTDIEDNGVKGIIREIWEGSETGGLSD